MICNRNDYPVCSGAYRGYFSQDGNCWPVAAEFNISRERIHGFSWDAVGPALLSGWVVGGRWVVLRKQYERYSVRLIGRLRSRGVISGRWRIGLGLFGRGLFEFWPDDRAADDLTAARENAMMPWIISGQNRLPKIELTSESSVYGTSMISNLDMKLLR